MRERPAACERRVVLVGTPRFSHADTGSSESVRALDEQIGHNVAMVMFDEAAVATELRAAGAKFAFVFGSRATGDEALDDSDLDVAAWWGVDEPPASWKVALPSGVDLTVLDSSPLWLAGRVALNGRVLFDDDPPARLAWQADTRLVWLDELPQLRKRQQEWLEVKARGG